MAFRKYLMVPIAIMVVGATLLYTSYWPFTESPGIPANGCRSDIWNHVHHTNRFRWPSFGRYPCVKARGFVTETHTNSQDGDYNFELSTGARAEIVCSIVPSWKEVADLCKDYTNPVTLPIKGQCIEITGNWVVDVHAFERESEIHPVSILTILPQAQCTGG